MTPYICLTCGTQHAPTAPPSCPICQDERQYVGLGGQYWTHHGANCAAPT